jgi:hypothetical protein
MEFCKICPWLAGSFSANNHTKKSTLMRNHQRLPFISLSLNHFDASVYMYVGTSYGVCSGHRLRLRNEERGFESRQGVKFKFRTFNIAMLFFVT